jgi:hypothetical protein
MFDRKIAALPVVRWFAPRHRHTRYLKVINTFRQRRWAIL